MEFVFLNKIYPNLESIHQLVYASDMTNKQIQYCIWHEDSKTLICRFLEELNQEDKEILDNIIRGL